MDAQLYIRCIETVDNAGKRRFDLTYKSAHEIEQEATTIQTTAGWMLRRFHQKDEYTFVSRGQTCQQSRPILKNVPTYRVNHIREVARSIKSMVDGSALQIITLLWKHTDGFQSIEASDDIIDVLLPYGTAAFVKWVNDQRDAIAFAGIVATPPVDQPQEPAPPALSDDSEEELESSDDK
jgi:hypothetical protein